ncbi:MAG: hypothetical protein CR217_07605 [Beijerinckiaceae bacterium]|nr:MAG: hypothetical protein CR217_07605 [Beijerinckiaceae bacterium]
MTADQPAPLPEPIALRPPSGARLLVAVLSILCFAYGPVEAQSADQAPTAIIGCPHMSKPLAPKNE